MGRLTRELGLTAAQIKTGLALLEQPRQARRHGQMVMVDPVVVREGARLYPAELYQAERAISTHIRRLQSAALPVLDLPGDAFGDRTPDESQAAAIDTARQEAVLVMTGGPGVGKTTVAKAIIATYEAAQLSVVCCAPTGKAAIRMKEQTGRDAKTIHSTIGMIPGKPSRHDDGLAEYSKDGTWVRGGPIAAGAVVCDETSMVDVVLFAALLRAIPTGARLLIIGDVDQLPSIRAGRVLFDLITSQALPTVRLTKIHRQASESRIPYVARDINEGRVPDLSLTGSDYTHWESATETLAAERIIRAITDPTGSIVARKGIAVRDIQVLSAQYDGACGVISLNTQLQDKLNPVTDAGHNADIFVGRGYSVRSGDKVIHNRNDYDLMVMNGEIGYVIAADIHGLNVLDHLDADWSNKVREAGEASGEGADDGDGDDWDGEEEAPANETVVNGESTSPDELVRKFGGLVLTSEKEGVAWDAARVIVIDYGTRKVAYSKSEARQLELAYAVSVHRSQGSQFKAVVVALHAQNSQMLTRALLYTAVTRAEALCLTVGTTDHLARAARNTRGTARRTALQERLATTTPAPSSAIGGPYAML